MSKFGCEICRREPEPGFIEMPNNGPIVGCFGCNREWHTPKAMREREFEMALAQRKYQTKQAAQ